MLSFLDFIICFTSNVQHFCVTFAEVDPTAYNIIITMCVQIKSNSINEHCSVFAM